MTPPTQVRIRVLLTRRYAIEALRQWWQDGPKARDLDSAGRVTACTLWYVPFWRITWEATGCVAIALPFTYAVSPVHCVVPLVITWTEIACHADDVGVKYLPSMTDEVLSSGRCLGQEIPASIDEVDVLPAQKKAVKDHAFRMLEERFGSSASKNIQIALLESTLISYPLWVVHYSYGGQVYQATIDGVTGEVLAALAPGDLGKRCRVGVALLIVCTVAVALSLWLLLAFPLIFAVYYIIIISIVCLFILNWKLPFVRYGSVLISGQADGGYRYEECSS